MIQRKKILKHAIILSGIPNSGKSTFYKRFLFDRYIRISRKELHSLEAEMAVMEACLANQLSFVVDNYNLTREDRAVYLNAARRNSYTVSAHYFPTSLEVALERNSKRKPLGRLSEEEIIACQQKCRPPFVGEGFKNIDHIIYTEDGGVDVRNIIAR